MTDQLDFPFFLDEAKLSEFLTRLSAIEDEQDRLRDEIRLLKDDYQDDFPLRAVMTAWKVVRARRKLEAHPKEPMRREHQGQLEALVERQLEALDAEARAIPVIMGTAVH